MPGHPESCLRVIAPPSGQLVAAITPQMFLVDECAGYSAGSSVKVLVCAPRREVWCPIVQ